MAYYTYEELEKMDFKNIGDNVKISDKASIYNCDQIEIGDHSRIDDFCVISGKIKIGRNVHITPNCLVAGGEKGIVFEDFTTIAYGTQVFTQSDDYSIMPGVVLEEGTSVGAMSLVLKSTQPWWIYVGNPAKRLKNRKKDLLALEKQYLQSEKK